MLKNGGARPKTHAGVEPAGAFKWALRILGSSSGGVFPPQFAQICEGGLFARPQVAEGLCRRNSLRVEMHVDNGRSATCTGPRERVGEFRRFFNRLPMASICPGKGGKIRICQHRS